MRAFLEDGVASALSRADGDGGRLPHLDGLRGLALLGVFGFHFGGVLPGGFLGVDVFFVLSGFLMTRALWKKTLSNTFSFRGFLSSRVLRICPALFVTIILSIACARYLLPTPQLSPACRSAIYASFFSSNHQFMAENGYHDAVSTTKPLLHTWSLGVEGQFYLLWSVVGLLGSLHYIVGAMTSLLLASILFNVYMAKEMSALFFMMPCRLYQFCAGSLAVLLYDCVPPRIAEYLNVSGLLSILISFCVVRPEQSPIYLVSLPSVVGTALVIATPNPLTCTKRGLLHPQLKFVGNVSYSAYLVHWPAIVLSLSAIHGRTEAFLVAAALTCFFSLAMFYGVEESFRYSKKNVSVSRAILFCSGLLVCLQIFSLGVAFRAKQASNKRRVAANKKANGFVLQGSGEYREAHHKLLVSLMAERRVNNGTGLPYVLYLGDSYSTHMLTVINDTAHDPDMLRAVEYRYSPACVPFPGNLSGVASRVGDNADIRRRCLKIAKLVQATVRARVPILVVLGLRWEDYVLNAHGQKLLRSGLTNMLRKTNSIILNGSPPRPPYDIVDCLWKRKRKAKSDPHSKKAKCPRIFTAPAEYRKVEQALDELAGMDHRIKVLRNSESNLCERNGTDFVQCSAWTDEEGPMYFDGMGHLTLDGARKASSTLGRVLKTF